MEARRPPGPQQRPPGPQRRACGAPRVRTATTARARSNDRRDDRAPRSFNRDDRPARTEWKRDDRAPRSNDRRDDRAPRSFNRDDRPARTEWKRDDRPARSNDRRDDRAPRSFNRDDRPARTEWKRDDRAPRSFQRDDRRADLAPRAKFTPPTDQPPVTVAQDNGFAALGLPKQLVARLARDGITTPFPIQVATIPDAMAGKDVLGRGQTGSGKTLAFGLPTLARLAAGHPAAARRPGP